ncbi:MAG: hypothetical protein ACLFU8_03355 [Anaerolineales bacterium]
MKFGIKTWILVLVLVLLFALASRPVTWAAPGQNPHRQTVPTRTPSPMPTTPPTEEPPPPPQPTPTPTPTATPTTGAVVAPTATEEPTATPTETATLTPSATATSTSTPSPTATPEEEPVEASPVLSPTPGDVEEPEAVAMPDEERGFPFCWVGLGLIIVGALLWLLARRRA